MRLTDEQRQLYRNHPAYSEGFYDARDCEPIFDDAPEPYRAGWEAYWAYREIFERRGFTQTSDGWFTKTLTKGRAALAQSEEKP
jgi:hypothetical protein